MSSAVSVGTPPPAPSPHRREGGEVMLVPSSIPPLPAGEWGAGR